MILSMWRSRVISCASSARTRSRASCCGRSRPAGNAIAFDEDAYSLGMSAGYEFDTDVIRYPTRR